jgi:hypothetical protein
MQKLDIGTQLGLNNFERTVQLAERASSAGVEIGEIDVTFPMSEDAICVCCAGGNSTANTLANLTLEIEPEGSALVGLVALRHLDDGSPVSTIGLATETRLVKSPFNRLFDGLAVRIDRSGRQTLLGLNDSAEVVFLYDDQTGIGIFARTCIDVASRRIPKPSK